MTGRHRSRRPVVVKAHAKINLDLRILGRRDDGYHELRTVLQTLALHDTLTFSSSDGPFELRCAAEAVPRDRTNLIWRAADAFWSAAGGAGEARGVTVTLEKRIPVQGGLGGGSTDAAATLVGLSRLWGLDGVTGVVPGFSRARLKAGATTSRTSSGTRVDRVHLVEIAAKLGADVPFFLCGGTALALGRGDEVYPLSEIPRHSVALLVPAFGVSTVDAYAWYDAAQTSQTSHGSVRTPLFDPKMLDRAQLLNDFGPVVEARHPLVRTLRERLLTLGATVAELSGSGSTVFGLFGSETRAKAAVRACRDLPCTGLVTHTISRREIHTSRSFGL